MFCMARPSRIAPLALAALAVAGCSRNAGNPAPPRVDTPADFPAQTSTIVVPLGASLASLEAALDRELPRRLWQINEHNDRCVPGRRIGKVKVTPDLGCDIVGQVTRGALRLSGRGDTLLIDLPVNAIISVRKVGGIAGETATGSAAVRAIGHLSIDRGWNPRARVDIRYDWKVPPGIDILGQRIEFADKADERLRPIVAQLERTLPGELAKLRLHDQLGRVWRQGFTAIQLNRDPPAWMRVTPRRLGFGGYRITGRRLEMLLAAEALTETFVGDRPANPKPTPLPPPAPEIGPRGLRFFIPVLADYRQLEPVVQRAVRRLAARGITLPGVGPVDAEFGTVTIYATTGNHLAVGIHAKVRAKGSAWLATKGTVWLTAIPYNDPGSQVLRVRDLQLAADTDSRIANLLVALFSNEGVQASIRAGLTHDFAGDYAKVLTAARRAVNGRREGDFLLSATIADVKNGRIAVTGQGLFLPVEAAGTAAISYTGPLR